jgi:hypothetical protein
VKNFPILIAGIAIGLGLGVGGTAIGQKQKAADADTNAMHDIVMGQLSLKQAALGGTADQATIAKMMPAYDKLLSTDSGNLAAMRDVATSAAFASSSTELDPQMKATIYELGQNRRIIQLLEQLAKKK